MVGPAAHREKELEDAGVIADTRVAFPCRVATRTARVGHVRIRALGSKGACATERPTALLQPWLLGAPANRLGEHLRFWLKELWQTAWLSRVGRLARATRILMAFGKQT